MKRILLAVLFAAATLPLAADCTLTAKAEYLRPDLDEYTVSWTPVEGATRYTIQESFTSDFAKTFNVQQSALNVSFNFHHATTAPTTAYYRVVAEGVASCSATTTITVKPNDVLRSQLQRAVFPIGGSAYGRYNSHFRTSLQLIGTKGMSGRIVFHPAGQFRGDDLDPSIPYAITLDEQVLQWDDVVASMGASGVGSIDVVPDAASGYRVPHVQARVYNDTGNGTFGTYEEPVFPVDFNTAAHNYNQDRTVVIPSSDYRVNIGLRSFGSVLLQVIVLKADHTASSNMQILLKSNTFMLVDVQELSSVPLEPGDRVELFVLTAALEDPVILFSTLTDNRTNDPSISVASSAFRSDVSSFFIY